MPSSPNYRVTEKFCEVCSEPLELNNSRDLDRKRFCSASCRSKNQWATKSLREGFCIKCGDSFFTKSPTKVYCSSPCSTQDQVSRSYKMLNNNPAKYFQHTLYKQGRELLSVEFMLELLEQQGGKCAISGQKLTFQKVPNAGRINTNASIDQIIAGGGYTEDNVQIVCDVVNRMKIDMDMKEFKFWCQAVLEG